MSYDDCKWFLVGKMAIKGGGVMTFFDRTSFSPRKFDVLEKSIITVTPLLWTFCLLGTIFEQFLALLDANIIQLNIS